MSTTRKRKLSNSSGSSTSTRSLRGRSRRTRRASLRSEEFSSSSDEDSTSDSSFSGSSRSSSSRPTRDGRSPSPVLSRNSPSPTRSDHSPSPPRSRRSSSPAPLSQANTNSRPPQEPNLSDFHRSYFSGAGETFGKGKDSLDEIFSNDQYADERKQNRFYPFSCEMEWEVASWLQRTHISTQLLDEFFKLRYVRCICAFVVA